MLALAALTLHQPRAQPARSQRAMGRAMGHPAVVVAGCLAVLSWTMTAEWFTSRQVRPRDLVVPSRLGGKLPDVLQQGMDAMYKQEGWHRKPPSIDGRANSHALNQSWIFAAIPGRRGNCSMPAGHACAPGGGSSSSGSPTWVCPKCAAPSFSSRASDWTRHWNTHHLHAYGPLWSFQPDDACVPCEPEPEPPKATDHALAIQMASLAITGGMKFNHYETQATVQRHKDGVAELAHLKSQAIIAALQPHVTTGVDLASIIEPIMHAESQLYTPKNEAAARRRLASETYPPLRVQERILGTRADGTTAIIYEIKLEDVTERDLHYDRDFYKDVLQSNTLWQASNQQMPDQLRVISDVFHGEEWRRHSYLGAADYGGVATLAHQMYCDGVDVVNAIGTASGHHHMTFIYTLPLNKAPAERSRVSSINLAAIIMSKDLKYFGPAIAISGHPGEPYDSSSIGAGFRRFHEGVNLKVPGHGEVRFRGWLHSFVGDAPAVAELVGTKQSYGPQVKNACNMCENANRPKLIGFSRFLACSCADDRHHDVGCPCKFALRTAERDVVHKAEATDVQKQMLGVDHWNHAFVRVPTGGRSLAQQPGPKDGMHVTLEGITKSSAASTIFMATRVHGWFSKEQFKARCRAFEWPKDKQFSRPWYIPDKVFKGIQWNEELEDSPQARGQALAARGRGRGPRGRGAARGRGGGRGRGRGGPKPNKETTLPLTAHGMLVWALHSIELFRPLIPDDAMDYAFWRAWVHHVETLNMMMQPVFTLGTLHVLEDTLEKWHTALFAVPEYKKHWVPKMHWLQHLAHDIWRFGPTRHNWCMNYEAKNQPLKRGCKRSNFANPAKATAEFWCESTDFHLQQQKNKRRSPIVAGPSCDSGPMSKYRDNLALIGQLEFMAQCVAGLQPSEQLIYTFLHSVSVSGRDMHPGTYAFVVEEGQTESSFCKVDQLMEFQGGLWAWVTIYPPSVLTYDPMGVLHITQASLAHNPLQMKLLVMDTSFAPLWHFLQGDGSVTFLAKW